MQKGAKRILGALIVLIMVLSILPASVFATGETTDVLEGWSITLSDDIGVKFHLNSEGYTVTATVNGAEVEPTVSGKVVTVNVAAAQMTVPVVLTVKGGDGTEYTYTYSVREYAETILKGNYDVYVKDMVKQMLNYGAAAQTYFDYNTENLANDGYELEATGDVPTDAPAPTVTDTLGGIELYGMSLVLRNKLAVRFYFTLDEGVDINSFTFSKGTLGMKDGRYFVEVGGINPQDLTNAIELNVSSDASNGALAISYSPLNYIVRMSANSSSASLKSLVQALYGYHQEAVGYDGVVPVGDLKSSNNGWSSSVIYATAPENDVYYVHDDWGIEYTPDTADVIKLVRSGVTTSVGMPGQGTLIKFTATDYCLKTEPWTIGGDVLPLQNYDYLIIEGGFNHPGTGSTMYISKTYIYNNNGTLEFSTTEPVLPVTYDIGVLQASANGAGSGGIYFQTAEVNDAPWGDWDTYYDANSIDNIKLIRNGETVSVALTDRNTICKFDENAYYLRLEDYTIGAYAPYTTDDVFIVEGAFTHKNSNTILNIEKTYIYHDGSAWVFANSLPTTYNAGALQTHEAGISGSGIYVRTEANDAPSNSDWSLEYKQTSADNIKIIRNGETVSIGIVGRPLLLKLNECDYYLKLEDWTVGEYGLNGQPNAITTDDVLIIEGDFSYAAENVILNIEKSYIYYDGTAWVCSDTEPGTTPGTGTVIDGGNLTEHADGWNAAGEIFVSMTENDLPVDESAEVEYTAQDGVIKLVRGENTSELTGTIFKTGSTDYYMVLDGDGLPLQANDYLIVEGDFVNEENGYTLNVAKTYILVDGDNLVYSTTEPVIANKYDVTGLTNHSAGYSYDTEKGEGGFYISHNAHEATFNSNWSVEYQPVSADAIKLVRNGETFNVAGPGNNTLVVYSATEMYFKLAAWTITGEKLPLVDGDKLIIEGEFKHVNSGDVLVIEKTTIEIVNGGLGINAISVGTLQAHNAGHYDTGIYFSTAEVNDAPWGDWNTYYDSQSVDNIKLIRNGETVSIGLTDRNTICKFGANDYALRLENWTIGDYAPYTTEDIFIVEGLFTNKTSKTTLNIEKTYIYYNGSAWVFATSLPTIYNAGVLKTHEAGMSGNGMYVRTEASDAPFNGDWSLEYKQTSADNIKVIRNGETVSIGIVDRPLLIKINECDYYLKLENWSIGDYAPITTDDMLIIEGAFSYAAENVTLNITKSYIYYDGSAWVCSGEEPSTIPSAGVLSAHSGGVNKDGDIIKGIYATGAATEETYNSDWSVEYTPAAAENFRLIRGGVTYNVGAVGQGTMVKTSQTDYYLKFESWTVSGNHLPLQEGDILVIEGQWYHTANTETVVRFDTTYITISNGAASFSAEDPRVINVGTMYAQGGANWSGNGINFAVDADNLPYNADWSVEYVPASNEAIKLIRNGQTTNIANTGAGTIVKLGESNAYLKLEQWMIGDVYPITEGDVLLVEGEFKQKNGDYTMVIDKTYIVIGSVANDEVTFTTHYEETDFGTVILPTSTEDMTIGMWNGSHHVFDHKQLQELQAAGITKIMGVNPLWIGTEDVNAWLDRVYSYGISVIFDLREWDNTLNYVWTYGESTTAFTLGDLVNHEAVLGFLMYDEPGADVFDDLAALKAQFDAVMPADKLFYVNLFPECAADSSLGTESSWWDKITGNTKDYDTDYVTAFLNALDIEVLSWDNYPLITNSSGATGIRTDYFHNFEVMASKNLPLWYTMLSAGHKAGATDTRYDTPTAEELRWQMAVAMTYGVRNIDHYVYASHEDGYSCMVEYETWNPTDLYYDILTVDNEYLAWDNIFMAYKWQGVGAFDTGSSNAMLTALENKLTLSNYGLTVTSSNQDLLVGVFDHNGDKAYMVTNAGSAGSSTVGDGKNFTAADATVTLNLGSGSYKCAAVIDNGEISYVAVNNNTVTLNVQAYEGVFVIPVLN